MISFMLCSLLLAADPAVPEKLEPTQPYQAKASAPVTYTVDFQAVVTAPQGTKKLQVWMPIPPNNLGQKITQSEWSAFPNDVTPTFHTEEIFGNQFAYWQFENPQGAQILKHHFQAKVWQLDWNVDLEKVPHIQKWPESFANYQRSEKQIIVDDRFAKIANGFQLPVRAPGKEFNSVMNWVEDNLTYDHSTTSLIASSEHALSKKRGDCSDYHGLCSSFSRALGTPTRVTYGLHLFPKNLPCHCKLEAFLPPYGWVSFDVSETQKLVRKIQANPELEDVEKAKLVRLAKQRLSAGFRDNTWLLHSAGTDYDLAPKASQKVPLIASIYAEADGKPLPLPDPADPTKREFSWMTAHKYTADREVTYPFSDWKTLEKK